MNDPFRLPVRFFRPPVGWSTHWSAITLSIAVWMVGLGGCRPPDPIRQAIGGTVDVSGTTSPDAIEGKVTFLPTGGMSGPAVSTAVSGGRYAFSADNGPLPGTYRVVLEREVSGSDLAGPDLRPPDDGGVAGKADLLSPAMQDLMEPSTRRGSAILEIRIRVDEQNAGELDLRFQAGS
ncbi:hypothetical protein [Rubripirellula lacrimiformis]|uniref:hypothetical protein n=1 Tax=Rubripirellula lacrimiformis TaxID=1930273 RepID=UPI0011A6C9A0|nr:hypothetical protein [Rubripirellula lacrimiformis]